MCKEFFAPSQSFERQDVNERVSCIGQNDTHMENVDCNKKDVVQQLMESFGNKINLLYTPLIETNEQEHTTYIPKCVKGDDPLNSINIDELETITMFQAYIIECKMKATLY
jgi:hypothetical protein